MFKLRGPSDEFQAAMDFSNFNEEYSTLLQNLKIENQEELDTISSASEYVYRYIGESEIINPFAQFRFIPLSYEEITNMVIPNIYYDMVYPDNNMIYFVRNQIPVFGLVCDFDESNVYHFTDSNDMIPMVLFEDYVYDNNTKKFTAKKQTCVCESKEFAKCIASVKKGFAFIGVMKEITTNSSLVYPNRKKTSKVSFFDKLFKRKKEETVEEYTTSFMYYYYCQWDNNKTVKKEITKTALEKSIEDGSYFEPIINQTTKDLYEAYNKICKTGKGKITLTIMGAKEEENKDGEEQSL